MPEFTPWPKTARLHKDMVITEKIDGTNSAVVIEPTSYFAEWTREGHLVDRPDNVVRTVYNGDNQTAVHVYAQSRNRFITPESDNFGFAQWVSDNAWKLVDLLGEGTHFGEYWGSGIQRGYGLPKGEKRFSLFNSVRWSDLRENPDAQKIGLEVVPELYIGRFDTNMVDIMLDDLASVGSKAAPGFMKPEGVIVWHTAARVAFKAFVDEGEK